MISFSEYINEIKQKTMDYKTSEGKTIKIKYEVNGNVIYFEFKNKEGVLTNLITKFDRLSKNKDPELEIFNWLKSINY